MGWKSKAKIARENNLPKLSQHNAWVEDASDIEDNAYSPCGVQDGLDLLTVCADYGDKSIIYYCFPPTFYTTPPLYFTLLCVPINNNDQHS